MAPLPPNHNNLGPPAFRHFAPGKFPLPSPSCYRCRNFPYD
eukprot:CAMPEP_0172581734 /NCGR_PEP_ID=MMETSP1068-20121228/1058_1 /TAXON_ID=35684 /ORGANISM="Pseudopedinella elastica, Strain CCMP716" /LENGTH=40 /DNA_ID= /DNA_START= /DNA_END= /DNA_ORIENTATION=